MSTHKTTHFGEPNKQGVKPILRSLVCDFTAIYRETEKLPPLIRKATRSSAVIAAQVVIRAMFKDAKKDPEIRKYAASVNMALLEAESRTNWRSNLNASDRAKVDVAEVFIRAMKAKSAKIGADASKGKVVKNRKAEPTSPPGPTSLPSTLETGEEGEALAS